MEEHCVYVSVNTTEELSTLLAQPIVANLLSRIILNCPTTAHFVWYTRLTYRHQKAAASTAYALQRIGSCSLSEALLACKYTA